MNHSIEVSIEKLSAPVEALSLDRRACSQLRRASIYTVAEIILAGGCKLKSAKSIGEWTANRIWVATARYLGLEEEILSGRGKLLGVGEEPISILRLPISTLHALGSVGVFRIKGLLKARPNAYGTILGLGEQDIVAIDRALRAHLAEKARIYLQEAAGRELPAGTAIGATAANVNLHFLLQLLQIDERAWAILEARAMELTSLRRISDELGDVSSATVRRIITLAHEALRNKLSFFSAFLDFFEGRACRLGERAIEADLDLKTLSLQLTPAPEAGLTANEQDVERMIILIRTLVMHPQPWFSEEIKQRCSTFVFLSCLAIPVIDSHEQVYQVLEARKLKTKQQSYKQLAYAVLAAEGTPLHWKEIAERAGRLSGRDSFYAAHMSPSLNSSKDLFVRVARGTYALREWENALYTEHAEYMA